MYYDTDGYVKGQYLAFKETVTAMIMIWLEYFQLTDVLILCNQFMPAL